MALTNLKSGSKDQAKSSKSKLEKKQHKLERKQRKLDKKLNFHAKVKVATESLTAKKAIKKKKKSSKRQRKLKLYDLSALSEFLPELDAPPQQPAEETNGKLNCKSRKKLVQRESMQLRAVLNNTTFQMDPIGAIQRHLELTQPPPAKIEQDGKGKKKQRNKSKPKKKGVEGSSSTSPSSMDVE